MPCKSLRVGPNAKLVTTPFQANRAFRSETYASWYNLVVQDCEYLYGDADKVLHAKCKGEFLAFSLDSAITNSLMCKFKRPLAQRPMRELLLVVLSED